MARGFLAGAATGLLVSAGLAAGVSLNMGYPEMPAGLMPEPEVDDDGSTEVAAPETGRAETASPEPDAAPERSDGETGLSAPSEGEDLPQSVETDSGAAPDVAAPEAGLAAPAPDAAPEGLAATDDTPVGDVPGGAGPEAPGVEGAPSISTEPAQPPAPDVGEETPDLDDSATEEAEPAREPAADEEAGSAEEAATDRGEDSSESETAEAPDAQDEIAEPAAPDAESDRPAIGTPATSLTDRDDAARSTRLPTIGDDDATGGGVGGATEDAEPPVSRYAADVSFDEAAPRLAIVLVDDGRGPLGPAALEAFPFPVTFAVDPAAPDAAERMRGYRERGFEVMALADVPEGAAASDVEVTLEASLRAVPEAVGVLEARGGGLQGSRDVTEQVAEYLAASGHGLVMQGQGLNTAASLARREGVPAGSIFRAFDGEGQDPAMQRRVLDRVAIRAGQDGSAIALGRLRADTVSALLLWGLQDRANELALVPITAVLSAEE